MKIGYGALGIGHGAWGIGHEFDLFSVAFFVGDGGDRDRYRIPEWW
ncbi:hypothetical protein [Nostoc sp. UHCC 0251]|nr:hypothetical protein [Nostoc sp. UHCC 0251]MEA5624228.1 hypothetical protein [Nostoc sp. UHCC 0251]